MSLYWHSCMSSTVRPEVYQEWIFRTNVSKTLPCKFYYHISSFTSSTAPCFSCYYFPLHNLPHRHKNLRNFQLLLALGRDCFIVLAQEKESRCVNRKEKR